MITIHVSFYRFQKQQEKKTYEANNKNEEKGTTTTCCAILHFTIHRLQHEKINQRKQNKEK